MSFIGWLRAHAHSPFQAGKQTEQRGAIQNLQCANCFCRLHLAAHSVGAQSVIKGHWRAMALFKTRNNNVEPCCLDEGRQWQVLSIPQQTGNRTTWCSKRKNRQKPLNMAVSHKEWAHWENKTGPGWTVSTANSLGTWGSDRQNKVFNMRHIRGWCWIGT